jgi:hypothetical protein
VNNGTGADVFYCDTVGGIYLGWGKGADAGSVPASHTTDHSYVSYTNQVYCPATSGAPLEGDWITLGSTGTTTVQNGVYISVFFVLQYAYSDYTTPAIGTSLYLTATLGDNPEDSAYSGNTQTLTVDLNLLARA